jgi:hypothetical protein
MSAKNEYQVVAREDVGDDIFITYINKQRVRLEKER